MQEITVPRFEIIKGNIDARLHSYIEHLLTYFARQQTRHPERKEIQSDDYPAKSTINIIQRSLATLYNPALSCSLMIFIDYQAIPSIQNELAGLLHADEKALRKISVLVKSDEFTSTTAKAVMQYAISETLRYLKAHVEIAPFLKSIGLDFSSKSLTPSSRSPKGYA